MRILAISIEKASIFVVFALLLGCSSQNNTEDKSISKEIQSLKDDDTIYQVVEQNPEFEGGLKELGSFLQNNIRYPKEAAEAEVSGKVFVTFVVEKDGSTNDVQILKGIGFGCDEEAVRVVGIMPKWKPGMQSGKAVRVKYNLPISFVLK